MLTEHRGPSRRCSPSPTRARRRAHRRARARDPPAAATRAASAVAVFSGVIALNYGWSSFTAARELNARGASRGRGHAAQLPAEHFPRIVATAAEMGAYGSDEHYELVLGGLVSGPSAAVSAG